MTQITQNKTGKRSVPMRVRIMTNTRALAERRSGGTVDAPRKHHREPPPSMPGTKHSEQSIAKARTAELNRRRPRGGSRSRYREKALAHFGQHVSRDPGTHLSRSAFIRGRCLALCPAKLVAFSPAIPSNSSRRSTAMHRIHSMALAAGLVAAVGIGVSAQTPPPQPQPKPTQPQTMPRDKAAMPDQAKTANPDAEFAQKAAMGGKHEVDGAKFAANKAQNADLKALAQRLIKDHTAANNELAAIMKTKKIAMGNTEHEMARPSDTAKDRPAGTEKPAAGGQSDRMKDQGEAWRSASGAAFDRAYADHLVTEHEKTISLFETEANSGQDAELKAFANKTLPTLRDHLKAAQDVRTKLPTTD